MNELKEVKRRKKYFSWKIALLKVFIQHYWLTCSIFWIKCSNKKNSFSLQIEYFKHHWEPWWCVYTEWISCCRKTSPMMILSTQTLHFLSAWWKEGEKKKTFFGANERKEKLFISLFFNFNFLLHVSLTSCCLSFSMNQS